MVWRIKRWRIWRKWQDDKVWQMVVGMVLLGIVSFGITRLLGIGIVVPSATPAPILTPVPTFTPTPFVLLPTSVSPDRQWFLYPHSPPQPEGRATQHGFIFFASNRVEVVVYPIPKTQRESGIYSPLSIGAPKEINFSIEVQQLQGEATLYIGVVRREPLTKIPAGWFFKVRKIDNEVFEEIGRYEGFEDRKKTEETRFEGKLVLKGNVLFIESGTLSPHQLVLLQSPYALYLGYRSGTHSSLDATIHFSISEVNYAP